MTNETVPKDILDKLNAGISISNVDFDIRDLSSAQDEVKAIIRADTAAAQTNDLKITLDGESVDVTATDLDIRDLTSVSDSVEAKQATFANLKTEVHAPAGTVIPTGIYGYDGGAWETLNTDTNNRLLVSDAKEIDVKFVNADMTGTVNSMLGEGTNIHAPANTIWTILALDLGVNPVAGSASGTHDFNVLSESNSINLLRGSSVYNSSVRYGYGYWESADSAQQPVDEITQRMVMVGLVIDDTDGLRVTYNNLTNANQTANRNIRLWVKEEKVA